MKENLIKKEIGYWQAFLNSGEKVWKYKSLWFWGILVATSGNISLRKEEQSGFKLDEEILTIEKISQIFKQAMNWLVDNFYLALGIFFLGLVLSLFFWIISLVARGGLIRFLALKKENRSWQENGREILKEGKKSFWRLLKLDVFFFLIFLGVLLLGLIFSGGLVVWIFFSPNIIGQRILGFLLALNLTFFLIVFFSLFLAKSLADFLVVLKEQQSIRSLWEGGMILKRKTKEFFKLLGMLFIGLVLASWAVEILFFLVQTFFSGVALVFNLPFWLGGEDAFKQMKIRDNAFIFSILALLVGGILNVFKIDYKLWWLEKNKIIKTLKIEKIKEESEKKALIEELAVVEGTKTMKIDGDHY